MAENCSYHDNPSQIDSNGDGCGNRCDPDLDNNGIVNVTDLGLLRAAFFGVPGAANWDPDTDFTGDDATTVPDPGVMRAYFFLTPGPGALAP